MKFAIRLCAFVLALLVDASGLAEVPGVGGRPLLFAALAAGFALRTDALTGGAWGFAGGLSLGVLYADASLGARALGGLLAGCAPVALRRWLFWRRWSGQAALGAVAGALFEFTVHGAALVRGEVAAVNARVAVEAGVTALLTGLMCPLMLRLMSFLERRA